MLHQPAPPTPRRSPKPPRTEQPKKPPPAVGGDSPAKRLARRRSWKLPDPESVPSPAPSKTPTMTPDPPSTTDTPELGPGCIPSPAPENGIDPPESDPGAAAVDVGEEAFDDKEVDSVEEDKVVDQIHHEEAPLPLAEDPPEELSESDPPPEIDPSAAESPPAEAEEEDTPAISMQETEKKMQRIVDLVMWRDVSRSALVFGMGTFFFISTSYTRDLNFSFISGVSYLGLFYLAAIFLLNSVLRRGVVDCGESEERWMVGEDEALVVIRMFLPYVNEILAKLKALFSGDPSTTMKMAMLLFALAQCGGSITFWTMGKIAFFGMFTIPRIFSSYSSHIYRCGTFWLERFRDAWESCTHKKAAAAAIFTIIWNLSSTSARIWSVFMLAVAARYYQENMSKGWSYIYDDGYEREDEHNLFYDHHRQHKEEEKQQQRGGGVICKTGGRMTMETSGKGRVTAVVATVIARRPQGLSTARQRLRGGVASKLEMGTKEKKGE